MDDEFADDQLDGEYGAGDDYADAYVNGIGGDGGGDGAATYEAEVQNLGSIEAETPAYADACADVTYDYPASPDAGRIAGSPSGGFAASASSLPEEIDISTHGLIEETVQRLSFIHGVMGVLIVDRDGLIVHATMPLEEAARLAGPTLQLLQRARSCVTLLPTDELRMLCVRTRKYELLLCSEADGAFAICCIQDPAPDRDVEKTMSTAAKSVLRAAAGTMF